MPSKITIKLPPANGIDRIETTQSLIFVGANGCGKTRLGAWIELQSPDKNKVHRISAQKSLCMPEMITPKSVDIAENELLFGHQKSMNKLGFKWHSNPATCLLDDYSALMVYLFSEETEANAKFRADYIASTERIPAPVTKMDRVKELWEKILPHRELVIGGLRITTRMKDSTGEGYKASDMSDGERVIFYLIGQCLAAPQDGIIVIDEPELHLHKSVQISLWTEIEKLRNDCVFIYLTHDVDFAASQEGATRVWLKSFDGTIWDWEVVEPNESLPNDLMLEILGSRKPVVFVEGENGSYDVDLYRAIFPNFLIVPRGSCSQVVLSVKALKANPQLHHLQACGIIDRDRRVDAEINSLASDSIFVLSVAEVENLFCTQDILKIVSNRLVRDPEVDFQRVSNEIFKRLQSELDVQVSLHVASEIQFRLTRFDQNCQGPEQLSQALTALSGGIDVKALYSEWKKRFNQIILTADYDHLLMVYNRKSLARQISEFLGLKPNELPELVVRLARNECHDEIRTALMKYFGEFPSYQSQHFSIAENDR